MSDWLRRAVLERGLISPEDLDKVERWPAFQGRGLVETLWRSGLVDERDVHRLLLDTGATDGNGAIDDGLPPPAALGALSRVDAEKFRALPISVGRSRVTVGLLDPSDATTLEQLAFRTGLLVEPVAVFPSLLFVALERAYDMQPVTPDVESFARAPQFTADDDGSDTLPPPSKTLPQVRVITPPEPTGDPTSSPLARGLFGATVDDPFQTPADTDAPVFGWQRERGPSSPRVTTTISKETSIRHRDSMLSQVLPLLTPPYQNAVLFLVRGDVAVGWDGRGRHVVRERIRDVLLPLTGPSAFARAWGFGMVCAGQPTTPTTVEHIFFRFLKMPLPSAFAVVPILVENEPVALLYIDRAAGDIDDNVLVTARQIGATLADGLAPLVANDALFGP